VKVLFQWSSNHSHWIFSIFFYCFTRFMDYRSLTLYLFIYSDIWSICIGYISSAHRGCSFYIFFGYWINSRKLNSLQQADKLLFFFLNVEEYATNLKQTAKLRIFIHGSIEKSAIWCFCGYLWTRFTKQFLTIKSKSTQKILLQEKCSFLFWLPQFKLQSYSSSRKKMKV